jgi:hypothetical protein
MWPRIPTSLRFVFQKVTGNVALRAATLHYGLQPLQPSLL